MKKVIRSIIVFWGIMALFPLFYVGYAFFTFGEGSYWLFGARDGYASAITWLDNNADGIRNADEKPLANVCIWYGYNPESGIRDVVDPCRGNHFSTDGQGKWSEFLPGGSCEDYFVFVRAPDGFHATTNLASNGCDAGFGFISEDVQVEQKVLSVDEFVRQSILIAWIKRILAGFAILSVSVAGTIWLQKT